MFLEILKVIIVVISCCELVNRELAFSSLATVKLFKPRLGDLNKPGQGPDA